MKNRYTPAIPYDNSERSQRRFSYLLADRTSAITLQSLDYKAMGAVFETYVDALHVSLMLSDEKFIKKLRAPNSFEKIREPALSRPRHGMPPTYVIDALGDYRESPSFFRRDSVGEPNEPKRRDHDQPHATQFAQDIHALARKVSVDYMKQFQVSYYPSSGHGGIMRDEERRRLKAADPHGSIRVLQGKVVEYQSLLKKCEQEALAKLPPSPDKKKPSFSPQEQHAFFQHFLQSKALAEFDDGFYTVLQDLKHALSPDKGVQRLFVKHIPTGQEFTVTNGRLNEDFHSSYPAILMLLGAMVGQHANDHMFVPVQLFNFLQDTIGVESQIHDNMFLLNQRISSTLGRLTTLEDDLLFPAQKREKFFDAVRDRQHGMQLLYTFHKLAGQLEKIYPQGKQDIAYLDMERLLETVGAKPWLTHFENTEEAATLLYAVERRLAIANPEPGHVETVLCEELLKNAAKLKRCTGFNLEAARFLQQAKAIIERVDQLPGYTHDNQWRAASDKLKELIEHTPVITSDASLDYAPLPEVARPRRASGSRHP